MPPVELECDRAARWRAVVAASFNEAGGGDRTRARGCVAAWRGASQHAQWALRSQLRQPSYTAHHSALHDEVRWLEHEHVEWPQQHRREVGSMRAARADDEPCRRRVNRLQHERTPVVEVHPAAGFELRDAPTHLAEPSAQVVALRGEDRIAPLQMLPFGMDPVRVMDRVADEPLEP